MSLLRRAYRVLSKFDEFLVMGAAFAIIAPPLAIAGDATHTFVSFQSMPARESEAAQNCHIGIRVIKGCGMGESDSIPASSSASLADIRDQLHALPFMRYRLLESVESTVRISTEASFRLHGANKESQALTVVPHAMGKDGRSAGRIHVSIDWRGPDNDLFLSSTMWVENERSMVLVAEGQDEGDRPESTLLAVRLACR